MHQQRDPRTLSVDDAPYIAPEVAQGYAGTERSDLYAFGVILYELCTGASPFQGETTSDILMQHIHGVPTAPALINPQIRPALTSVIMRSLAKEPSARFSSATALVVAVAKALNTDMPSNASFGRGMITPPSFSGISGFDTMDNPTYISPLPQSFQTQSASLVPPIVASSNTPILQPPPVSSATTPILSYTPTGDTPNIYQHYQQPVQTGEQKTTNTSSASGFTPVAENKPAFVTPPTPLIKKRYGRGVIALAIVLLIAVLSAILATFLFFAHPHTLVPAQQTNIVGHAFFASSGLISNGNNQGITDELQIDLQNIPDPQPGKKILCMAHDE
jgi:serine/threonine protein kinase